MLLLMNTRQISKPTSYAAHSLYTLLGRSSDLGESAVAGLELCDDGKGFASVDCLAGTLVAALALGVQVVAVSAFVVVVALAGVAGHSCYLKVSFEDILSL